MWNVEYKFRKSLILYHRLNCKPKNVHSACFSVFKSPSHYKVSETNQVKQNKQSFPDTYNHTQNILGLGFRFHTHTQNPYTKPKKFEYETQFQTQFFVFIFWII